MIKNEKENIIFLFDSYHKFCALKKFINKIHTTHVIWYRKASDIKERVVVTEVYQLKGFINEKIFYNQCLVSNEKKFWNDFEMTINDKKNLKIILHHPQFAAIFFKAWESEKNLQENSICHIFNSMIEVTLVENTGKKEKPNFYPDFCRMCFDQLDDNHMILDKEKIADEAEVFTGLLKINSNNTVDFLHDMLRYYFASRHIVYTENLTTKDDENEAFLKLIETRDKSIKDVPINVLKDVNKMVKKNPTINKFPIIQTLPKNPRNFIEENKKIFPVKHTQIKNNEINLKTKIRKSSSFIELLQFYNFKKLTKNIPLEFTDEYKQAKQEKIQCHIFISFLSKP